ncbi:MAG TPA: BON domain-containing protein [Polyangia bacterium]
MKQRRRGIDAADGREGLAGEAEGAAGSTLVARVDAVEDLALREQCQRVLAADPALVGCAIGSNDREEAARRQILGTEGVDGRIIVKVEGAVVVLDGEVPSLRHKRLAGVLAHRLPGCRGVSNGLRVSADGTGNHEDSRRTDQEDQEDNDDEIALAVRLALSRNPVLNRSAIDVKVENAVVCLEGSVTSAAEARAAVRDAAHVLGVARVEDRLSVISAGDAEPPIRGRA